MKIAVVHEWLHEWAGSEQVLASILEVLPGADLFALVDFLSDSDRERINGKRATTTFLQRFPFARSRLEWYLPLMPLAVEQLDLSAYDLIVSSSHAVAKGVITGPDQIHLSYVYSPMRYAWDLQHQYLKLGGLDRGLTGIAARFTLHYLRLWDTRTANGVDAFACDSEFVRRRIRKCYARSAQVIYPGVDVERLPYRENKDDFYLAASRLMPYKRIDIIVKAFARLNGRKLVVIGTGPDEKLLRRTATDNVTFLGRVSDAVLHDHLSRARAFVFAAQEDFGILPIEAQACGTPVLAFGKGGATETVRGLHQEAPTGVFFGEQTAEAIVEAVRTFETNSSLLSAAACRENATRFSPARFKRELRQWIDRSIECARNPALR
jgi:glycosyltransferase involved in cell wall biosynthesis